MDVAMVQSEALEMWRNQHIDYKRVNGLCWRPRSNWALA